MLRATVMTNDSISSPRFQLDGASAIVPIPAAIGTEPGKIKSMTASPAGAALLQSLSTPLASGV